MANNCIKIDSQHYCDMCPHVDLQLVEDKVLADKIGFVSSLSARCTHADLCNHLWNHLCDYYEDDYDSSNDDVIEDDEDSDWTFCSDASYEDRQL